MDTFRVRAYSHRGKANTKAKKTIEPAKTIKEKFSKHQIELSLSLGLNEH